MEAQIGGTQRKVFAPSVRPLRADDGDDGITVRDGSTTPFVVARSWSAPAGVYPEAWYLIDPATREVLHEADSGLVAVFGLQGLTSFRTEVREPLRLRPGRYQIVFALGGVKGGELDVAVAEAPAASVTA